jgi:hypothetical protein
MTDHGDGRVINVGQLRPILDHVPAAAPLLVGIRDRHHFNALQGELRVVGVAVLQRGDGRALVFDVESIS